MRFCLNEFLYSFSYALDCVEGRLYGVEMDHTLRVAFMAGLMSQYDSRLKLRKQDCMFCAIFHDNALSEFDKLNYDNEKLHLEEGEKNLQGLFFWQDLRGSILYSHENYDGSGPYQKEKDEIPFLAQCIHLAHDLDEKFKLNMITLENYEKIKEYLYLYQDKKYSKKAIEAFISMLPFKKIKLMAFPMKEVMKIYFLDFYVTKNVEVYALCRLVANMIDSQSHFTRNHSIGVASKVMRMADHYGLDKDIYEDLYFAAAMHDIGKLVIDKDIIEKHGKLTDDEFNYVQNHAYYTYKILHGVRGLETVTKWASFHHEKLDGSGYPFQLDGDTLDFYSRLIGCMDIYQALTEPRPYKDPFTHEEAMKILYSDARAGKIDSSIVRVIDLEFKEE